MDTLAAMRTFVAIVDAGSLTGAADVLDRSQPAVVRSLAVLEQHLGTRLLQRTTRRMSLTPEGAEYLERCRQILADVDEAERVFREDGATPNGLVRLTAPAQFGRLHIAPAMAQLLDLFPDIEIDLVLLDRNVDFVAEGIDLGLRIGPLPDSSLIAIPLGDVRRVVCASPALIDRMGRPVHPVDLEEKPCIQITNLARAGRWSFEHDNRPISVRIGGPFRCNTISGAIAGCIEGAGFGQFLSYQVRDHVAAGRLVPVLEGFEVKPRPVSLVYPGGRLVPARVRAVVDFLRKELQQRPFADDA